MPLMPLASSSAKPYAKKKKKKVIRVPFISQDFFMDLWAARKTSVAPRLCLLGDGGGIAWLLAAALALSWWNRRAGEIAPTTPL